MQFEAGFTQLVDDFQRYQTIFGRPKERHESHAEISDKDTERDMNSWNVARKWPGTTPTGTFIKVTPSWA